LIEPPLRAAFASSRARPFVVGLCGAQGSGKTTVSAGLRQRLERSGLSVALLSIDDLYLPREVRRDLSATHPLLLTRGVPGTHDIALGQRVLDDCRGQHTVALPRFSKVTDTLHPEAEWEFITGPVDIILLEGWCVGAVPQDEEALWEPVNRLEREEDDDGRWRRYVNNALATQYAPFFDRLDWLVLLAAPGFGIVSAWRREQEHALRASLKEQGRGLEVTLDDAGVERFIQHFQRLTEHILKEMPGRADLTIALDEERRPSVLPTG
jgi:D-glycerate 3-kinase